jgi:hypothetical protein
MRRIYIPGDLGVKLGFAKLAKLTLRIGLDEGRISQGSAASNYDLARLPGVACCSLFLASHSGQGNTSLGRFQLGNFIGGELQFADRLYFRPMRAQCWPTDD